MRVLIATSEATPFAKTGGLADVCGALPVELQRLGIDVAVIMPAFRQIHEAGIPIEATHIRFDIPIGGKIVGGVIRQARLPGSQVPVYFVEQPDYYDRPQLYWENDRDYDDNCERFVYFCRAVMEVMPRLGKMPQVIHGNDWQCGLLPALQKIEYRHTRGYERIASLITIHNMAYQGVFWHWDMLLTGLEWKYFNWREMEFHGRLNLLKTGLVFADGINTVSPTYAREIREAPLGCGLEGVLRHRGDVLTGIVNGVNYDDWNPATDQFLDRTYSTEDWKEGKADCKAAVQRELNLPERPNTPLIGLVGRLADQKGWDLVAQTMQRWAPREDAQWAILGTGEGRYHELLARLAAEFPAKVAARLEFSNRLAHRIEAGADMFLMPSAYEPCGLNQLYSLKYGTVPVVRATGGLADTIVNADEQTLAERGATGFTFQHYSSPALEDALRRACEMYRNRPDAWAHIVVAGMQKDWSWTASARRYAELYQKLSRQVAEYPTTI